MHHKEFEPPNELQDIIKCFWYDCIELPQQQSDLEVVPDGYAEIIFILEVAAAFLTTLVYNHYLHLL